MTGFFHRGCGSPEHDRHRRTFLKGMLAGSTAAMSLGGLSVAHGNEAGRQLRRDGRRVLFLWLAGGSSQFETWDPKPGRRTGGPFRAIPTAVPGVHVCELMPRLARLMKHFAIVRSLDTEISAHAPAGDLMNTGWPKEPALEHPEIGTILARELAVRESSLPDYVSIFATTEGHRRPDPGFLGGRYAPLHLHESLRPQNIDLPAGLTDAGHAERERMRAALSRRFAEQRAGAPLVEGYNRAYERVRGLMRSEDLFDLDREPAGVRDRYGQTEFGRHCLLARRLIEAGIPMVKVARGFWDSHHDNFESHRELVPDFDRVLSTLVEDLEERGLLEVTTVVVLSEFGRTPKINKNVGRDHYAAAWSCAFAGAGIRGGTVHGETDEDGISVVDGKAGAGDVAATIFRAAGIDPEKHYYAGLRPVPLAKEDAVPIESILA